MSADEKPKVQRPALGKAQKLPPVPMPRPKPGVARRLLSGKRGRRGR